MRREQQGSVCIDKLSKQYNGVLVLRDIELNIQQGEFIAIVGRSGCGKSTLLRLISGLESPCAGHVLLEGTSVQGLNIGTCFMFQDSRLLPWKSVLDNVRIGTPNRDKKLALQALQMMDLEARAQDWPRVLSGGQKQRVALARALVSHPKLLLLDEPLGALDALTRIEMQQLIEKLWMEQKFTVILVTHDVSEAVALADRVLLIDAGRFTMDVRITLARPRERDSGFIHFEKQILDRLLDKKAETAELTPERKLAYSI